MNTSSKETTPIKPSNLQRCPSNVSDISGISSFSFATKTASKGLYKDYQGEQSFILKVTRYIFPIYKY